MALMVKHPNANARPTHELLRYRNTHPCRNTNQYHHQPEKAPKWELLRITQQCPKLASQKVAPVLPCSTGVLQKPECLTGVAAAKRTKSEGEQAVKDGCASHRGNRAIKGRGSVSKQRGRRITGGLGGASCGAVQVQCKAAPPPSQWAAERLQDQHPHILLKSAESGAPREAPHAVPVWGVQSGCRAGAAEGPLPG